MLGIVILNYENWDETVACLRTIFQYEPTKDDYKIYVVDNGSKNPPSKEFLDMMRTNENIVLIQSEENIGFARGNNLGIKRAREENCDYVIVSNSDIYYRENSLDELLKFYQNHSGICYPRIYNLEGEIPYIPYSYDTSLRQIYYRHTILNKIFRQRFHKLVERSIDMHSETVIENYLNAGSCFMLDKPSLDILKELDEHTFLYYEEMILSKRAHESGIHIYYCPMSEVTHGVGKSTGKASPFSRGCMAQSAIYYARRCLNKSKISVLPLYWYFCLTYLARELTDKRYRCHGGFRDFKIRVKKYL